MVYLDGTEDDYLDYVLLGTSEEMKKFTRLAATLSYVEYPKNKVVGKLLKKNIMNNN